MVNAGEKRKMPDCCDHIPDIFFPSNCSDLVYDIVWWSSHIFLFSTDASSGLEWRVRFEIIRGICEGLLHLHGKRILHLDLKPGNILVDDHMVPKIADFGLSRFLDKEQTRDITLNLCGTLGYLAPEFLRRGQVAFASDIYSLGVIIMEILTGEKEHPKYDNVVETWMNRLEGSDQWETQLEQVRVCTKIGIECMESNPKKRPVIVAINSRLIMASTVKTGISIQSGANISSSNSGMLCKLIKLDSFDRKALRMFHKMNGGATLDRPKSTFTLFNKDELQPFLIDTNFIRKDGSGKVYKGLVDNVPVTVRKPISSIPVKLFALELGIQSQAIHKNISRFIGCCLEVDTPVLVFEFHSTVSLHDIFHINIEVPLNLETRLSIATTSAGALAYVHSAHGPKILHGDVRPANILLDDHFVVKISNFGLSRLIIKTGTIIDDLAYTDPVYLQTGLVTEKSDVYSFGLVILELLTRKKASCSDNNSLVRNFLENHNQGRKATEFFDKEIAVAGDLALLDNLANIVTECLSRDVDLRPGMKEVEQRINVLLQSLKL